jgi:hypothetical protein
MTTVPAICANPECQRPFTAYRVGTNRLSRFCSRACAAAGSRGTANPNYRAEPGYSARHKRIVAARGPARTYTCHDCGGPARDWSLIHGRDGNDPADYQSRCTKCHKAYDQGGELSSLAKLTWEQVREIRALRGTVPGTAIAALYGVGNSTIYAILKGLTWRDPPSRG